MATAVDRLTLPEKCRVAAFVLVAISRDFHHHGRHDLASTTVDYAVALSDLAADLAQLEDRT